MKSAVKRKPGQPAKAARNAALLNLYRQGRSVREVAEAFGVSRQRVHQIVQAARANMAEQT